MKMRRSKSARSMLLGVLTGLAASVVASESFAELTGERIVRGQVQINRMPGLTTIYAPNKSIIEWEQFNVGVNDVVEFIQPSHASSVLNRIVGPDPSYIDGTIEANGRVYIVNPAGVIFGPDSIVNVGALIAAAGHISDHDFIRSNEDHFTSLSGEVINNGTITTSAVLGAVHMIGQRVENHGSIVSDAGFVSLVAGHDVILKEMGNANFYVIVDSRRVDPDLCPALGMGPVDGDGAGDSAGVLNTGLISAKNGPPRSAVTLAAGDMYSLAIRNTGEIITEGGDITLSAGSGIVRNEGLLNSSVDSGRAGNIWVLGPEVVNDGEIRADANDGRAGKIKLASQYGTTLGDGSVTSAAGGTGVADGGEIRIFAEQGDHEINDGATLDVSGGDLGGKDGTITHVADCHPAPELLNSTAGLEGDDTAVEEDEVEQSEEDSDGAEEESAGAGEVEAEGEE